MGAAPDMETNNDVLGQPPDGVRGHWRVETFSVSDQAAQTSALRALFDGPDVYVPPGVYKRLTRGSTIVMSNTPMELRTNAEFIRRATGRVLINGLGLGIVLTAILQKPDVHSITVIETAQEVIDLVAPTFCDDLRVTIIHADAFEYRPPTGARYDVVWHDIWDDICPGNLREMTRLHRKYARLAIWQGSWAREQCKRALLRATSYPIAK